MKKTFIITLVLTIIISCGKINNYEWEKGCQICKDHKGVMYLNNDATRVGVRCNDGYYTDVE